MYVTKEMGIMKVDTIVYVFVVISALPLLIYSNKNIIIFYVFTNLGMLFLYVNFLFEHKIATRIEIIDYLFDSSLAMMFMGVIIYNIFRINKESLDQTNSDIEKREIAEISLRISERKYRTLFENLSVGFALYEMVYDENNKPKGIKYVEVNTAYEEMMSKKYYFEEDGDEKKLRHIGNLEYLQFVDRVLKTGIPESIDFLYKAKYLNIWLYRPDAGLVAALLTDVSERVNIRKQIENAHALVKYIIDSLPISIITIDENQIVTQFNKSAEIFISSIDIEIKGSSIFNLFPLLQFIEYDLNRSLKDNLIFTDEKSILNKDGGLDNFKISIMPITDFINKGSLIIIENITEKKHIEELMIQNEKMTSVASLAAGIAHEINNPLGTIVQGCQNLIRRTEKDMPRNQAVAKELGVGMEKIEEYFIQRDINNIIESISNAAGKANSIIKNMLQFSRKNEVKKVNCDIKKLLDDTIELVNNDYNLKKKYNFTNLNIVCEYEEILQDGWVNVTEIQQVIFNILQNAIQAIYTFKNSEIKPLVIVRAKNDKNNILIEIEDNGPGMDEKTKRRIFEPFFTTKDVGEGTGLGLSVSYVIIKNNHHGEMFVQSKPGKGTTFQILLPSFQK